MEERSVSPEHEEEVIELLDIVQPAAEGEEGGEDIIELAAEDIESLGLAVPPSEAPEEEPLELVDVVAEGEAVERGGEEPAEPAEPVVLEDQEVAEAAPAPEVCNAPAVEQVAFDRFAADVDARFSVIEELWQVESQSSQEHFAALRAGLDEQSKVAELRFNAIQQACSAEVQALREELSSAQAAGEEDDFGQRLLAVEERIAALGESHESEVQALHAGLALAEERLAALAEENAELRKGLADAPTAFLSDSSLRLALEEMVDRMIEARMSELSTAQEKEAGSSAEEEAAKAVAESVEVLEGQVKGLHERMDKWEEHYEQEAALAAARIIREEIAAMRAGAARMQH